MRVAGEPVDTRLRTGQRRKVLTAAVLVGGCHGRYGAARQKLSTEGHGHRINWPAGGDKRHDTGTHEPSRSTLRRNSSRSAARCSASSRRTTPRLTRSSNAISIVRIPYWDDVSIVDRNRLCPSTLRRLF